MTKTKTKGINKPKYSKARQDEIHKNTKYHTHVPDEYKGLPTAERVRRVALKHSNDGECWWIYQYIMNSYGRR
tara:strand:+ start:275 stop:493 length:219 start_codon:yes stop_codon:yes gene_type:complete